MSRTRYAPSGTLRIAYELRGTLRWRRPWLVLVQGMGFDRQGWEPVLPKLRRRFRLVLVDNRGFGRSDRSAGSFGVADMAGDIIAVLDHAGIRKAHVMGASLGGLVAQELAITHPERVDGLVLACTAPGWPLAYPMPMASMRLIAATAGLTAEAARRRYIENALSARTVQHHPELVSRLIELQGSRPPDKAALSAQAAAGARYAGRLRQSRIRARTLVLHGAANRVVDPRNGKLLADRIPRARLVTFPELGHLLFWEDPDGFAAAVRSFLLADARPSKPAVRTVGPSPRATLPKTRRLVTSRAAAAAGRAEKERRAAALPGGRNKHRRPFGVKISMIPNGPWCYGLGVGSQRIARHTAPTLRRDRPAPGTGPGQGKTQTSGGTAARALPGQGSARPAALQAPPPRRRSTPGAGAAVPSGNGTLASRRHPSQYLK